MKIVKLLCVAIGIVTLLRTNENVNASEAPKDMALIPAGEFTMGDALKEGALGALPLHRVSLYAFYMDTYKVSNAVWHNVYDWALNNGYDFEWAGPEIGPDYPVYKVKWYDAVKWCNARSEMEGKIPAYYISLSREKDAVYRTDRKDVDNKWVRWDAGYRLPTEAEWEWSARGGLIGKRFPWGDTISHTQATYYSSDKYDYDLGPTRGYHPVRGISPVNISTPNGYGLYDMAGNVSDWCWDWYSPYTEGGQQNPHGPVTYSREFLGRIIRGGSWGNEAWYCRTANRDFYGPYSGSDNLGFRTVLPVTEFSPLQAIQAQPIQPTYTEPPQKEEGKKNIVVVTHGWQPAFLPVDIGWVGDMTNAISKYLINQRLTEWQVHAYRWEKKAHTVESDKALVNAKDEGVSFGKYVVEQEFDEVDIIAHSAGAGFAQAALETVKRLRPNIKVYLTFLDPFVGFDYAGKASYGKGATWAVNYFSRDVLTSPIAHEFTEGPLENAYNVDVTFLDTKNKAVTETFRSSKNGALERCFETRTSHAWPHEFYMGTIPPNTVSGSGDFGFLLSGEAGGLARAMTKYGTRGNDPEILGTQDTQCPVGGLYVTTPSFLGPKMEFKDTSSVKSPTGIIELDTIGITLITGSPAWLTQNITLTNKANFVSFEYRFMSGAEAEGLLSVYWDTNVIGTLDERLSQVGSSTNRFVLPSGTKTGAGVLGFRLDTFSGVQSSVTITNVAFGFAGLDKPFSLNATGAYENGQPVLQLTGPAGHNYSAETSSNLVEWTPIALLVNTSGTVRFTDSRSNNTTIRFYRAVVP